MRLYRKPRSLYWYVDVSVAGTRHRFSTKRTSKEEATRVVSAFVKKKLDADQLGVHEEVLLKDAVKRYVDSMSHSPDHYNLVTRYKKLFGLDGWSKKVWHMDPNTKLHDLTKAHVSKLREARRKEGLKPSSINLEVRVLQRTYNLAVKEWDYRVNPNVAFPIYRTKPRLRYLLDSLNEEQKLLQELDPETILKRARFRKGPSNLRTALQDQYDLVVFLIDTGARYSEVASIGWDAVDTRSWKTINIYRDKVGSEATLVLTDRLKEILKRRYEDRRERGMPLYVFPAFGRYACHKADRTKPRGYAVGGIRRAIDRAGLNSPNLVKRYGTFTVHSFRHTFASRLAQQDVSLYKIQLLLGHKSPQMTQRYSHLMPDSASAEAASILNSLNSQMERAS